MKFTKLAAAAALATATVAAPGVALAQDAGVEVTTGATIYGSDGVAIGTVQSVEGDTTVVLVDGMSAPLPTGAIGANETGLAMAYTKTEIVGMLQASKQQAEAARDAALVVGADVSTVKGMPIGAIKTVEGNNVIVSHGEGAVALTREQFAIVDQKLVALVAMSDIMAAMEAQGTTGAMTAEGGQ